jgi:N-acetylneuraminic acid mutarotase
MIYIIGGWFGRFEGTTGSDLNYQYNPISDSWLQKASCPGVFSESPSCTHKGKIYLFGNRETVTGGFWPLMNSFRYDPDKDTWDSLSQMIFVHTDGDAVSLGNNIYLIGGANDYINNNYLWFSITGKSERYNPETDQFSEIGDMPHAVSGHASAVYNQKILVFGGDTHDYSWDGWRGTNLIQEYDPTTDAWRLMKRMPFPRFECKAVVSGDYVYIIGGHDNHHKRLKEVWRFDLNYLEPLSN